MLEGKSKLYQHPKANTLYLTIPSGMVTDSQFKLKSGDKVNLMFNPKTQTLEITKVEG